MVHCSNMQHVTTYGQHGCYFAIRAVCADAVLSHGQDHILVEIQFPDDYSTQPFFMRVVSPRYGAVLTP
jgi:hypothetical protein